MSKTTRIEYQASKIGKLINQSSSSLINQLTNITGSNEQIN